MGAGWDLQGSVLVAGGEVGSVVLESAPEWGDAVAAATNRALLLASRGGVPAGEVDADAAEYLDRGDSARVRRGTGVRDDPAVSRLDKLVK